MHTNQTWHLYIYGLDLAPMDLALCTIAPCRLRNIVDELKSDIKDFDSIDGLQLYIHKTEATSIHSHGE